VTLGLVTAGITAVVAAVRQVSLTSWVYDDEVVEVGEMG
jgi:hypothetical protein